MWLLPTPSLGPNSSCSGFGMDKLRGNTSLDKQHVCSFALFALLLPRRTEFSHGLRLLQVRSIADSSGNGFHNTQPTVRMELGEGECWVAGVAYGFKDDSKLV